MALFSMEGNGALFECEMHQRLTVPVHKNKWFPARKITCKNLPRLKCKWLKLGRTGDMHCSWEGAKEEKDDKRK